jgi:hypothetical protein
MNTELDRFGAEEGLNSVTRFVFGVGDGGCATFNEELLKLAGSADRVIATVRLYAVSSIFQGPNLV